MIYDVIIIGAGPAGMYAGLIIQKGTPVQSVSEDFHIKVIEAGTHPGGLTKYAFIQICKSWAFHGRNLVGSLYKESCDSGVEYSFEEVVHAISFPGEDSLFCVATDKGTYYAKYVIVATGIVTFPDVLKNPGKTNIGLHTPQEMAREFKDNYNWNSVLVVGNHLGSISNLRDNLQEYFATVKTYLVDDAAIDAEYFGLPQDVYKQYDGIVFDYNSYKLKNGTTGFINNLPLKFINGYIVTDSFGETSIPNLFAVGTVTAPTSGVMAAIYTAQIAAFEIGRRLRKTTKADPSGRFPFFPRELFWNESLQCQIKESEKENRI